MEEPTGAPGSERPRASLSSLHRAWSYGGALQCLASQKIVEDTGYSAEFIDYWRPDMKDPDKYYAVRLRERYGLLGAPLSGLYRYVRKPKSVASRAVFSDFQSRFLNISSNKYFSMAELESGHPDADAYIVTSDQVWNDTDNSRDKSGSYPYFFTYLPKDAPKIAFASSFGKSQPTGAELAYAKEYLPDFLRVSVRERGAATELNRVGIDATHVADPTLLLSRDQWIDVLGLGPQAPARGVFGYAVGSGSSVAKWTQSVAKRIGEPRLLVTLRSSRRRIWERSNSLPSVPGFVDAIRGSRFAVTDSFHGAVFCIVFHVPFVAVSPEKFPARMIELLSLLDLEDRLHLEVDSAGDDGDLLEVDWAHADEKLAQLRSSGMGWISEALNMVSMKGRRSG